MDTFSVFGLIIAVCAILIGQHLEGGHINTLLNAPAFVIVVGGTLGAVLLETPNIVFIRAMALFPWIFLPPKNITHHSMDKILQWSKVARREGFLGLEKFISNESDAFSKVALQHLVDGKEPKVLEQILEHEIDHKLARDLQAAGVFESMGGYAPTIGILGAVIGLIQVMGHLAEPEHLGSGIAVAFVATVYGVGFANLILLPVSNKLRHLIEQQRLRREMIAQGILGIAEGENPRILKLKLHGYLN